MILLGRSIEGRRIEAFEIGRGGRPRVLILGGTHGDEPKSVDIAWRLIHTLAQILEVGSGSRGLKPAARKEIRAADPTRESFLQAHWLVVPCVNPDGFARRRRRNARGVDINRNFPTDNWTLLAERSRMYGGSRPASEPETRAVIRAVKRHRPAIIVAIHSIDRNRYCVNYDGPAKRIARRMSHTNGYPLAESIGYPTPGSFGTWAGIEQGIPTITLELPSHHSAKRCWEDNAAALLGVFWKTPLQVVC